MCLQYIKYLTVAFSSYYMHIISEKHGILMLKENVTTFIVQLELKK